MVAMTSAVSAAACRRRAQARPRHAARFRRRRFGRRRAFTVAAPALRAKRISDDVRLFAATFAAGFLFVSVLIG